MNISINYSFNIFKFIYYHKLCVTLSTNSTEFEVWKYVSQDSIIKINNINKHCYNIYIYIYIYIY